jgi:hypothetical protein
MKRAALGFGFAFALSGCIGSELLTPHVEPGGTVVVTTAGHTFTTTALADATKTPFTVSGFSTSVTFGLVADVDGAGHASRDDLAKAGDAADVTVGQPGSTTQLEIHAGGSGCVGGAGVVHLHVTSGDALSGDFQATGTVSGGAAPCDFSGSLADVPIAR